MPEPFEELFDCVDALDTLLEEGPDDESESFLRSVKEAAQAVHDKAQTLTVDDVDNEFTEAEDS